jgi:hypothetical protein
MTTTRFGPLGQAVDALVFRPLIGWATAWSFDRLRLWIERGLDPAVTWRYALVHGLARITIALIWLYHGFVPKLLVQSPDELALLRTGGIPAAAAPALLTVIGLAEIAFGLLLLVAWQSRWPFLLMIGGLVAATAGIAATSPAALTGAFNPLTLNLAVIALGRPPPGRHGYPVGGPLPPHPPGGAPMTSIYRRALGPDFDRLHPQVQCRFGFSSADRVAAIGAGVMERVWHGAAYTLPFLYLGAWRRIMFPEQGRDVPFTIQNYAFRDAFGRETVTWLRTFETRRRRRFDAYMIYSERRRRIVDYLGTHQHLAVDLDLSVDERGGLRLRSGAQRFFEGPVGFSFPLLFSGVAEVCEWYDEATERFRIEVTVRNRRGTIVRLPWLVPRRVADGGDRPDSADILPRRQERRE